MSFIALGINHKTAPLALRERLSFAPETLSAALDEASHACAAEHIIILSTCNRTEIYALGVTADVLLVWLAQYHRVEMMQLKQHAYQFEGTEAVQHVIRVAAGLDSMIIGEPQIFGQIKQALNDATNAGTVGKQLAWLFEQIVAAAKKVRSSTPIGEQAVSLGFAVAKLTQQIFSEPKHTTLMLVGAGEMNRLVAENLCQLGIQRLLICNRTEANAQRLAAHLRNHLVKETAYRETVDTITTLPLAQLANTLHKADIVCSCTASMQPLIDKHMVKKAIKKRRYEPMLLVDLAVPRDICEDVAKIDDVYHYAIDDLQHVVEGNLAKRRQAGVDAEVLVSQLALGIEDKRRVKEIGRDIAVFKAQAEQVRCQLLARAHSQIEQGAEANEVLATFSKKLTAKLIHSQFKLLREVANIDDKAFQQRIMQTLKDSLID